MRKSCNLLSKFASRTQIECSWGRWLGQRIVLDCFKMCMFPQRSERRLQSLYHIGGPRSIQLALKLQF